MDGWGNNGAQQSQKSPIARNNNQATATTQTTQHISILWAQYKLSGPLDHHEQAGNHQVVGSTTHNQGTSHPKMTQKLQADAHNCSNKPKFS